MKNPFKTRKILLISPHRTIEIEIPFIGKMRFKYKQILNKKGQIETGNMKGQH